jgi:hypothetical protein
MFCGQGIVGVGVGVGVSVGVSVGVGVGPIGGQISILIVSLL